MNDFKEYNNLAKPKVNRSQLSAEKPRMEKIYQKVMRNEFVSENELYASYFEEIKSCLEMDDLKNLLEKIFHLENTLDKMRDHYSSDLPDLGHFYRSISPSLLRGLWAYLYKDSGDIDLFESWRESVRVALEEELYQYQDKFFF